jgi:hypothetical protein
MLAAKFARIANLLCAAWDDPPACREYLAGLLVDKRGGRKGFPRAIRDEIQALNTHYANVQRPLSDMLEWDDSVFKDWERPELAVWEESR